jgi:hypothetical protein
MISRQGTIIIVDDEQDAPEVFVDGAAIHLTKPGDYLDLKQAVEKVLGA